MWNVSFLMSSQKNDMLFTHVIHNHLHIPLQNAHSTHAT